MAVTNSGMTLYTDNDADANWVGTNGDSTEVFWQGVSSEYWIVSKTATEVATLTISADMSAAKYFTFGMLSTIAPFYNTIKIRIQTDVSNYEEFTLSDRNGTFPLYRAIAGEFITSAPSVEFGQGTEVGTLNKASIASVWFEVDNSTSGNIRSVENHYIDAMYYGNGRNIGGTTAGDKLFEESDTLNITGDVLDCCTMVFSGEIFAQTDLSITTTTGNSYGETLVFRNVPNTSNSYTLTVTGTADFQATTIKSADTSVTVNLNTSTATSWQMLGGSVVGAGTTIFKASQVVDSVVFTDRTSLTHNGSLFENNTVNTSGLMTVLSTGTCTNNVFNKSTAASATTCSDLSHIPNNQFISDGSGHAAELTGVAGSYTWDCVATGYDTGTATDNVAKEVGVDATGNEHIHITATSGTFNISVNANKTVPSVSVPNGSTTVVNVTAGQATYTQTAIDKDTSLPIEGVAITVLAKDATGPYPYQESVTITRATTTATVTHTAHGMKTGHKVKILGANENEFNRIKTITVTTTNAYTYTVLAGAGDATGTITSTAIIIDGLTNASGQISDTRGYGGTNQPITGTAKKGSGAPVYKSTPITGTIDSANGLSITTAMTKD